MQKKDVSGKMEIKMMSLANEGMKREISQLKKSYPQLKSK